MGQRRGYRNVVEAQRAPGRDRGGKVKQFFQFMLTSLSCTLVDQLLAAVLFERLPSLLPFSDFTLTLMAAFIARTVSLTLSYAINHKLIFAGSAKANGEQRVRMSKRESLPRFIALAGVILTISSTAVFAMHQLFGIAKWKTKLVADFLLFFANFTLQRKWVFNRDVQVRMSRRRR